MKSFSPVNDLEQPKSISFSSSRQFGERLGVEGAIGEQVRREEVDELEPDPPS